MIDSHCPVVGREGTLQLLAACWGGSENHSVVITGAPGLGRTRLMRETLTAAARAGHSTHRVLGTSSTNAVPLGAVAHLLPTEIDASPLVLLNQASSALAGGVAPDRRLVLGVDDAHLLDELSLALVHRLVVSGSASVVLTVSADHDPPESVAALWKDGLATRVELRPLAREEADALVAAKLGGLVDSRTAEQLWRLGRGNPLFVHELIDAGREGGVLRPHGNVWRWEGPLEPSKRLRELVHHQWGELTEGERTALELLALDEPLAVEEIVDVTDDAVVASLERRGLVDVERDDRVTRTTLAHPLHAAVLRTEIPEVLARRLRSRLLERRRNEPSAPSTTSGGVDHDLLRAARLELDAGPGQCDVKLLTRAAIMANAVLDHPLAERLARAALADGAGFSARLALHEAVRWQGRCVEAEDLAAEFTVDGRTTGERVQFAVTSALNLFFGQARPDDAEAALRAADAGRDPCLRALRGVFAFFAGRSDEAVRTGLEVLRSEGADMYARAWAATSASVGLAVSGRSEEASRAVTEGRAAVRDLATCPEASTIGLLLAHAELLALWTAGRMQAAEESAAALHRQVAAQPASAGDAVVALNLGGAALLAGRPRTAVRWLSEAAAGFDHRDPFGLRRLCIAQLAQARALSGDVATAREVIIGGLGPPSPAAAAFEPFVQLAGAWRARVEGEDDEAADHARKAALLAAEAEQWAVEAGALHAAVCFGRTDEVDRLEELADRIDGPLVTTFARHGRAVSTRDAAALEAVARDFEALGCDLLAAEAASQAAMTYKSLKDRHRAAAAATRAAAVAEAGGIARVIPAAELPERLTEREYEVAKLAAQGHSNQAIAAELVRSVRTVEAHLDRAFAKLGVHRRSELADALAVQR